MQTVVCCELGGRIRGGWGVRGEIFDLRCVLQEDKTTQSHITAKFKVANNLFLPSGEKYMVFLNVAKRIIICYRTFESGLGKARSDTRPIFSLGTRDKLSEAAVPPEPQFLQMLRLLRGRH